MPRILLVDDIEDNIEIYASYLRFAGFEVQAAREGQDALAKVEQTTPDVVVMDLAMPRLDGWAATRLIKSNPQTQHVIVLVLTGHAMSDDVELARAAGADEICTKPCLPEALLERVRALLGMDGGAKP